MQNALLGDDSFIPIKIPGPVESEEDRIRREEALHESIRLKRLKAMDEDVKLSQINAHPIDFKITFDQEKHIYTYEGQRVHTSVTSWIEKFVPSFDKESAIRAIFNEKATVVVGNKIIVRHDHKTSKYKGMDRKAVLDAWTKAATDGTSVHDVAEAYFEKYGMLDPYLFTEEERKERITQLQINGNPINPVHFSCLYQIIDFETDFCKKWTAYRTEWNLYSKKTMIAGQLDMLFKNKTPTSGQDEFAIIDWKRLTDGIDKKEGFAEYTKKCYYPISHLDNSKRTKYGLQLNMYKKMLKELGFNVVYMALVILNPNAQKYELVSIPDMEKEIDLMIEADANLKQMITGILDWEKSGGIASTSLHPRYPLPPFYEKASEYAKEGDQMLEDADQELELETVSAT